jgi:hypothetical protein
MRLLSWASASLQHIRPRRSTHHGFCLPASFRLQGLATLWAVCSLHGRAGFLSRRQRSWDFHPSKLSLTTKCSGRSRPNGPTCCFSEGPATLGGHWPHRPQLLGFALGGDPLRAASFYVADHRMLPWAWLFQGFSTKGLPGFRPRSSHALLRCSRANATERRRLRVSIGLRLARPARHGEPREPPRQPS